MRYTHQGGIGSGTIAGDIIHVHTGAMFGQLCKGAGDAGPVKARKRMMMMMMIVKC